MSNEFIVKFRPFDKVETNRLNMFNLFRLCRNDEISFNIVAKTDNMVAKNGNHVEVTFDFVERIVQLLAFDNVVRKLLLVWTGLKTSACTLYSRVCV